MKKIIQGEKKIFTIRLTVKDDDGISKAFNLETNTEITVCFKTRSTTVIKNRVAVTVGVIVVGAEKDGKIQATLEVTDINTLDVTKGDIEIVVTKPSNDITKFQIINGFEIFKAICP